MRACMSGALQQDPSRAARLLSRICLMWVVATGPYQH